MDGQPVDKRKGAGGNEPLSIVVVGASGDLARRKILPALFALYCQGYLPERFQVVGFARSELDDVSFRDRAAEHLTCRYVPGSQCGEHMAAFLSRCRYVRGAYASVDAFLDLYETLRAAENGRATNRLFYLAVPPAVVAEAVGALGDAGLADCGEAGPWSRVVVEKPFGRDRASSDALGRCLAAVFSEEQTYRIDHYLGKEVVQNMMVLRFANLVFEPLWSRLYIESVQLSWKEDLAVGDRGGYFDEYGIVRDVMQNHLLQMLALIAMEQPLSLAAADVRDEKVKVLRQTEPASADDLVLGQYGARGSQPAYREEPGVQKASVTPTFAAVALRVRNRRWDGVPFLLRAGKGLDARSAEIHIRFRPVPGTVFAGMPHGAESNTLTLRVQPDEAILLRTLHKAPGLAMALAPSDLDLRYAAAFAGEIPEAYERLLLDVLQGDRSLFIREDELAASWDVFTPLLHQVEREGRRPEPYPFGSTGPAAAAALASRFGALWR